MLSAIAIVPTAVSTFACNCVVSIVPETDQIPDPKTRNKWGLGAEFPLFHHHTNHDRTLAVAVLRVGTSNYHGLF